MTPTDYLLVVLGEEGAEITQAASKCIRFGRHSTYGGAITNAEKVMEEFYDAMAVIEMLQEIKALPTWSKEMQQFQKEAKKIKVNKYRELVS